MHDPLPTSSRKFVLLAILWGVGLSLWVSRGFLLLPEGQIHANHEAETYVYRLVEFRECLARGQWSPQWCPDFRGGLGGPYFSYYQPGFFYAASVIPWGVSPIVAIGLTIGLFSLLGYCGTWQLLRSRFGQLGGVLGGSMLLLSVYTGTELYIRGDLSQYAAMMTLPVLLWALLGFMEHGRRPHAAVLAVGGAALVCLHPCVALVGYAALGLATLGLGWSTRDIRRTGGAIGLLGLGGGMAAFYWLPVAMEWNLVAGPRAFEGFYHYSNHFVEPHQLLGSYDRETLIPFTVGPIVPVLLVINTIVMLVRWNTSTPSQRRVLACSLGMIGFGLLVMSSVSTPLWDHVSLLQRLQFPWRLFSLLTVAAAIGCGAVVAQRPSRPAIGIAVALLGLMLFLSGDYTQPNASRSYAKFDHAAQMADATYFAPDLADEWVPRGAAARWKSAPPSRPIMTVGMRAKGYHRDHDRLTCEVTATEAASLLLPHYYFPVGWTARLADRPIALHAGTGGLMRIDLPAGAEGRLVVSFAMTPMRRYGWMISAVCAVLAMVILVRWRG